MNTTTVIAATTTTKAFAIADRVASLRELAVSDPQSAQDAAWAWFQRLGKSLPDIAAEAELAELFRNSTSGDTVNGQTEGIVLGFPAPHPEMDLLGRTGRAFAERFVKRANPWLGKRFIREEQRGTNSVTMAALVVKVIAPNYGLHKVGDHYEGFDMRNWVAPSSLDPATQVMVIDYQINNPWPMSRIIDELVEIVPNTYLGKMVWTQKGGNKLWAYFALKTPVGE